MLSKSVECWAVAGQLDTALHYYVHILSRFVTSCRKRCPLIRDVNHHRGSLIQVKEIHPGKEKKQQAALLPLWPPSLVASRRWRAVKKLKSLFLARRPIDEMVGQLILCTAVLLLIDFWTSSLLGFQFILLYLLIFFNCYCSPPLNWTCSLHRLCSPSSLSDCKN